MLTQSIIITIESSGKSVRLGTGGELGIIGVSGAEAADYDVDVESNGSLDGGYISGARISQRVITITTDTAGDDPERIRARLVHLLSPRSDARITVTRNGVTRWITGRCNALSITEANMYRPAGVSARFVCPQPYWRDPDDYGKDIAENLDNVVLPFVIPPAGFVVSVRGQSQQVELVNGGDVDCGLRARIVCKGGVTNPLVKNTGTGEYIKILDTFAAGDELSISTEPRAKTVKLNGANHMQTTDRASTFFSLTVGSNTIEYDADDGYANMAVYIYYTPLYLGV